VQIDVETLRNNCKTLRLLYVEDDLNARDATLKLFHHFFDHITVAKDGEEGFETFKKGNFDLVISDINMPKKDGLQMLQEIREIPSDVPFLLLSAYSENEYFTRSISLGADYFIIKPIQQEQFFDALTKVVRKIEYKKLSHEYQQHLEHELTQRTQEIVHKLYNDELTSLSSRYAFFEDMGVHKQSIVYLIDIENFHIINDIYGHEAGNAVLKDFGRFLTAFADKFDLKAYRLSGDEFALMKENSNFDKETIIELIHDLYDRLKQTQFISQKERIRLHLHVGIACGNDNLFEHASIALDYAKANTKDFAFYSSENDRTKEQHRISEERHVIQHAIDEEGIVAVYQGIVDRNGNICKYETLMRLKEKNTGHLISPSHFLSTSIQTGQYDFLSMEIMKQGMNVIENSTHVLSFNFSYRDIVNIDFLDELENFFLRVPDAGSRIVFEITEGESMESYDIVKSFLSRFRKYGIKIAIDDFGTGFSNFSYILEMEPDYLKIDASLIKDIDTNPKSLTLTKAIIDFSKKLNIKVIAEFVHNETIFRMLKELDVDEYQGFHFAEPVCKNEIV